MNYIIKMNFQHMNGHSIYNKINPYITTKAPTCQEKYISYTNTFLSSLPALNILIYYVQ